jgi:hypothetical protein
VIKHQLSSVFCRMQVEGQISEKWKTDALTLLVLSERFMFPSTESNKNRIRERTET